MDLTNAAFGNNQFASMQKLVQQAWGTAGHVMRKAPAFFKYFALLCLSIGMKVQFDTVPFYSANYLNRPAIECRIYIVPVMKDKIVLFMTGYYLLGFW